MSTKKTPAAKKPVEKKEEKGKEENNPFAKFIGKKTNDGQIILAVNVKTIKRVNQEPKEMAEIVFQGGRNVVELSAVGLYVKKDKKKAKRKAKNAKK